MNYDERYRNRRLDSLRYMITAMPFEIRKSHKEGFMRKKLLGMTMVLGLVLSMMSATSGSVNGFQRDSYAGTWEGTYASTGGNKGSLSYTLSKDSKGQWQGTVKFTNEGGEQTADLKSIRIASGKFSATLDTPDGQSEVAIEGAFKGKKLGGTYSVSSKASGEKVDGGTWATTKNG
jgi:hypothetical protein